MLDKTLAVTSTLFAVLTCAPAAHAAPVDVPLPNCNQADPVCVEWRSMLEYAQSMNPGLSTNPYDRRAPDPARVLQSCIAYYTKVKRQIPAVAQRTCQSILS